ncbi:MAG: alanine racemase, partial [Clostridia bacterium]|nr:alanine racemase [Clostridia bacterium]
LYGYYPSDEVARDRVLLTPAMEVITHVIHVKEVPAGFRIGYGHTYTAPSPRRIATLSIGYADGFNRCLSGGTGYVLLRGKRAPVVGRVCMDQIMVDVTEIPEISVGEEAVILGESGEEALWAEEFGALCHSFSYEVLCTFLPRVRRIYLP